MTNRIGINLARLPGLALVLIATLLGSAARGAEPNAVTITTTKLEVTDRTLEWGYRITNNSDEDVWLCAEIGLPHYDREIYLAADGRTLMIRRRFDLPRRLQSDLATYGSYIRLEAGQSQEESLLIALPIYWRIGFERSEVKDGPVLADRLTLEIGFYSGDLPEKILQVCEKSELEAWSGGRRIPSEMVGFITRNERTRNRQERLMVVYGDIVLGGIQAARLTVTDQVIPYAGQARGGWRTFRLPNDLVWCTRIDVRFRPSMLEHFFPYASEQSLLDTGEKEYLHSQETLTLSDRKGVRTVINDIRRGGPGGVVAQAGTAQMRCFRGEECIGSITLYGGRALDTEDNQRFFYPFAGWDSLRSLTPQIRPFELRIQCARNLRDLWYRLHLYQRVLAATPPKSLYRGDITYPPHETWTRDLTWAYGETVSPEHVREPFACPATGEHKCHYAMNPNCGPELAGDMVLLFETKAGWNQHGGAELFTFDNHDPKGGCVLLNDGTVKFIRTEAELHALRWE